MRRILAACLVSTLIVGVLPPAPGYAATDIAHSPPTDWTTTAIGMPGSSDCAPNWPSNDSNADSQIIDGNDSTGRACSSYPATSRAAVVRFDNVAGSGQDISLHSFRMVFFSCQNSWSWSGAACSPVPGITRIEAYCGATTSDPKIYDDSSGWAGSLGAKDDTAQVNFDSTCDFASDTGNHDVLFILSSSVAGFAVGVATIELYETDAIIPADFTDYVAGLRIEHPPFQRVITWEWIKTFIGSWEIRDEADNLLGGGAGPFTTNQATFEHITIQCLPICGHDVYTISVAEVGHEVVTYAIDSDSSGFLIPAFGGVVFTNLRACYNASTNQCATAYPGIYANAAAGVMSVVFRYECNTADGLGRTCERGEVFVGHSQTDDFACEWQNAPVGPIVGTSPDLTYEQQVSSWNTQLGTRVMVRWNSTDDPLIHGCRVTSAVNVAGGEEQTRTTPQEGGPECDIFSLPCQIGIQLRAALDGFFGTVEDVWTAAVFGLRAAAMEKLPFAYMVLAIDGVNAQIARASLEVVNTDDCEGVTIHVPLYYGVSNTTPTPTSVPITVLTCAQLEPAMGTSWYQAVRSMLDPALWLLFGWAEFKALWPKPSLTG